MKKIILFAILIATSFTSRAQALGYEDLSLLFSSNFDLNGTSRFVAMSGAFGALGGDVSSLSINPAGMSVFNNSDVSLSFNSRTTDINSNYYGRNLATSEEYFSLSNAGAVLLLQNSGNNKWSKIAFGVNYRILRDFDNTFYASGNSGFATFIEFPLDQNNTPIQYDTAENQNFSNFYNGEISELNFGLSALYEDNFYIGASVNTYSLSFSQQAILREQNNDGNGNTLNARYYQENFTSGSGFSLGIGAIYRASDMFRFGLSYQSPTWYTEIFEDTNITNNDGFFGDTEIEVSNDNVIYDNTFGINPPFQSVLYKLRTPSRLMTSMAIVFGKFGLFSIDYTSKNYKNLNLSNGDFSPENQFFDNFLRSTYAINAGTEWRLNRLSIRGGYRFEQSPDASALKSDNLEGFSFGLGYNFGNLRLDFAYSDNNRTAFYNFYPQYNQVNPADLNIDNKNITLSLSLSL